MKLFWGLIETEPKHKHTFDGGKWNNTNTLTMTAFGQPAGSIDYYQNTCLTCGELVEKGYKRVS